MPTTVSVQITSKQVTLTFATGIYIDAQWPAQNMRLNSLTHTFEDNVTKSDVSPVNDEWGDRFIDQTETVQAQIAETVGTIIHETMVDRQRHTMPDPWRAAWALLGRKLDRRLPTYDPLTDPNPEETLAALAKNLTAMPSEGSHDEIKSEEITGLTVGATIIVNKPVEQVESGTGFANRSGHPNQHPNRQRRLDPKAAECARARRGGNPRRRQYPGDPRVERRNRSRQRCQAGRPHRPTDRSPRGHCEDRQDQLAGRGRRCGKIRAGLVDPRRRDSRPRAGSRGPFLHRSRILS